MPTKKFEGASINVLLEKVRREVGTNAKIVRAQKVRRGGFFGFFAREFFELTVDVPGNKSSGQTSTGKRTGVTESNGKSSLRTSSSTKSEKTKRNIAKPKGPGSLKSYPVDPLAPKIVPRRDSGVGDLVRKRYLGDGQIEYEYEPDQPSNEKLLDEEIQDFFESDAVGVEPSNPVPSETLQEPKLDLESQKGPDEQLDDQDRPVLEYDSELSTSRYWTYFLVPTRPNRQVPGVLPTNTSADDIEFEENLTKGDASGLGGDVKVPRVSTEKRQRDLSYFNSPDPRPGPSRALEPLPTNNFSVNFDEQTMFSGEEMGVVGDVPALPVEIIQILNRARFAGELGPGRDDHDLDAKTFSLSDLEVDEIESIIRGWKERAIHGAQVRSSFHPAEVFQSAPFIPPGLSSIGYPAALFPDSQIPRLARLLADDDIELDSPQFALDLFVSTLDNLPPAPQLPEGQGKIMVVVGELVHARSMAAKLAETRGIEPDEVVIAAPQTEANGVPAWMLIPTRDVAVKRRARWSDKDNVTIVALAAPLATSERAWANEIIEALSPDVVCGVVESTHKPEDIASWAIDVGRIDCLAVRGKGATRTPAAILACGIPVALIDGEEATSELWASIVSKRLAIC